MKKDSQKEKVLDLIKDIGMESLLTNLIKIIEGDEDWIRKLRRNIVKTLKDYRARYGDETNQ